MITSITIFERTHMQHEQQKAQEEEKKRLFEEELEWKTWVAFWIKVHFVCVPVHACIVLVHVLFYSFSQIARHLTLGGRWVYSKVLVRSKGGFRRLVRQ
jgi:hypothetical protein